MMEVWRCSETTDALATHSILSYLGLCSQGREGMGDSGYHRATGRGSAPTGRGLGWGLHTSKEPAEGKSKSRWLLRGDKGQEAWVPWCSIPIGIHPQWDAAWGALGCSPNREGTAAPPPLIPDWPAGMQWPYFSNSPLTPYKGGPVAQNRWEAFWETDGNCFKRKMKCA